jgi:hypothetical protein
MLLASVLAEADATMLMWSRWREIQATSDSFVQQTGATTRAGCRQT